MMEALSHYQPVCVFLCDVIKSLAIMSCHHLFSFHFIQSVFHYDNDLDGMASETYKTGLYMGLFQTITYEFSKKFKLQSSDSLETPVTSTFDQKNDTGFFLDSGGCHCSNYWNTLHSLGYFSFLSSRVLENHLQTLASKMS